MVSNNEGRVDRIKALAKRLTESTVDVKQIAASLHGLLNFVSVFVLESALKPTAREYSRLATRPAIFDSKAIERLNGRLCTVFSAKKTSHSESCGPSRASF